MSSYLPNLKPQEQLAGLEQIFTMIERNPENELITDRYLLLVKEVSTEPVKVYYIFKLVKVLKAINPSLALELLLQTLQFIHSEHLKIGCMDFVHEIFMFIGKKKEADLIQKEKEKLKARIYPSEDQHVPEQPPPKKTPSTNPTSEDMIATQPIEQEEKPPIEPKKEPKKDPKKEENIAEAASAPRDPQPEPNDEASMFATGFSDSGAVPFQEPKDEQSSGHSAFLAKPDVDVDNSLNKQGDQSTNTPADKPADSSNKGEEKEESIFSLSDSNLNPPPAKEKEQKIEKPKKPADPESVFSLDAVAPFQESSKEVSLIPPDRLKKQAQNEAKKEEKEKKKGISFLVGFESENTKSGPIQPANRQEFLEDPAGMESLEPATPVAEKEADKEPVLPPDESVIEEVKAANIAAQKSVVLPKELQAIQKQLLAKKIIKPDKNKVILDDYDRFAEAQHFFKLLHQIESDLRQKKLNLEGKSKTRCQNLIQKCRKELNLIWFPTSDLPEDERLLTERLIPESLLKEIEKTQQAV